LLHRSRVIHRFDQILITAALNYRVFKNNRVTTGRRKKNEKIPLFTITKKSFSTKERDRFSAKARPFQRKNTFKARPFQRNQLTNSPIFCG
jgi:hypothetical protein